MTLPIVVICSAAVILLAVFFQQRSHKLAKEVAHLNKTKSELEDKLVAAREISTKAKLELQKKDQSLNELRDQTKAKLRKFAKKADGSIDEQPASDSPEDNLVGLEKTISTLKIQLNQAQQENISAAQAAAQEVEARKKTESAELQNLLTQAKNDNKSLKAKLDGVKSSSHLADLGIKVEDLPVELVKEVARLNNKAEHNHNMRMVLQGKFNLVNEKYSEIQRKYFDVCRQLAMNMGKEVNQAPVAEEKESVVS